jgi:hypothetical protein
MNALWAGFAQLAVLAVAAIIGNVVYRRVQDRSQARRDLITEIHDFTVHLYKPRKLYQICISARDSAANSRRPLNSPERCEEGVPHLILARSFWFADSLTP